MTEDGGQKTDERRLKKDGKCQNLRRKNVRGLKAEDRRQITGDKQQI